MLLTCSIYSGAYAQKYIEIEGYVYNKTFRTGLIGGKAYLHDNNDDIVDSCEIGARRTINNVTKQIERLPCFVFYVMYSPDKKYSVEITYSGYEALRVSADFSTMDKRQDKLSLPDAFLSRSAVKLNDVVVTATKVKFYNKGDTLVYNADAFQLAEGSMLDALIDQLPGVEMKDGGQIYVNGKFVENLTLNGRDFFSGNHQLLLENLGAYTVKDIAVYDRLGERSKFSGVAIPGDKQFTMDVRLKKEYLETWLLNAEGGMGTSDRYMGRMFFARNTSHSLIGLFGNFNNLNDQGRPGQNTLWRQADKFGGMQRVQHAGLTYSVDGSRSGISNIGDLLFSRIFTDLTKNTMRTNLLPSGTAYDYAFSDLNTDVLSLGHSHRLNMTKKFWNGWLYERVNYKKTNSMFGNTTATFDKEQQDMSRKIIEDLYTTGTAEWSESLVNRTISTDNTNGHALSLHFESENYFKFKKSSDILSLSAYADYANEKNKRFNKYQINYRQNANPTSNINDYYNRPVNSFDVGSTLGYSYNFVGEGYVQAEYTFEHSERNTDSYRYQLDRLADHGIFGTVPEGYASVIDPFNSHTAHYNTNANNLVIVIVPPAIGKAFEISLRPTLDYNMESLLYVRNGIGYKVSKNFLLPGFNDAYTYMALSLGKYEGAYGPSFKHRIELKYNLKSKSPELMDMVPVTDDTDPLNIYEGVNDLKIQMNHHVNLNWRYRPRRANINNTLGFGYNITSNALTRGYVYDGQTGVRTWRSYNTSGNWSRYATNTFSLVFGKNRQFTLSADSRVENSQAADVIGTTDKPAAQFAIKNWLVSQGLKLAWQMGKQRIGINGSFVWRNTSSEHDDFSPFHATNINCGVTGNFKLPCNIGIETDFTLYSRNGYADSRLNTNDLVWNARLSYAFGKGHWVAMLDGFDLLRQLSNVTYGITAQARTITYTNTLPRYCLLHLQYKINIMPKVKRHK